MGKSHLKNLVAFFDEVTTLMDKGKALTGYLGWDKKTSHIWVSQMDR